MQDMDFQVDRSTIPISIEVNEDSVADPDAHPVKAGFAFHYFETSLTPWLPKVTVKNVDSSETEVVHAKYVVGADGSYEYFRKWFLTLPSDLAL